MIDSTNGDTSPPRLYKGDRILLRQVTAVLGEEVSGLPRSSALPPPRRREKLYWRAYLAYLTDPLQRSVDWAWLEFMDGTMSPVAFRRRAAAVGWRTMRDELEAMVAEGVLRHVARQGGFDPPLLDHRLQGRQEGQEPPEPGLPMPDICGKTRALWRRVVGEMGPRFAPVAVMRGLVLSLFPGIDLLDAPTLPPSELP